MHFDGKLQLDLGRRDQGTSVMYGSTGLMMELDILSSSKLVPFFKFWFKRL